MASRYCVVHRNPRGERGTLLTCARPRAATSDAPTKFIHFLSVFSDHPQNGAGPKSERCKVFARNTENLIRPQGTDLAHWIAMKNLIYVEGVIRENQKFHICRPCHV